LPHHILLHIFLLSKWFRHLPNYIKYQVDGRKEGSILYHWTCSIFEQSIQQWYFESIIEVVVNYV
jgi:hypothetical protein